MDGQYIPNKDVRFANNVIANDPGHGSAWQQVQVAGPVTPPPGSNAPSPSRADDDLRIVNNIFWNDAPEDGYSLVGNRVNTLDPQIDPNTHLPAGDSAPGAGELTSPGTPLRPAGPATPADARTPPRRASRQGGRHHRR